MDSNFFQQSKPKVQSKVMKFLIILFTLLLLLIPIAFVSSIIDGRIDYKYEAVNSVSNIWGGEQTIYAPQLHFLSEKVQNNETLKEKKYFDLENYSADININTEIRKKGLFKIPVYTADVVLKGEFLNPDNINNKLLTFTYNVENSIGFLEEPHIDIAGIKKHTQNVYDEFILPEKYKTIPFEITYKIRGLNKLSLTAKAHKNNFNITSNWADPSFEGNFLPAERTVDNNGFTAKWSIPSISFSKISNPKITVSLLVPVDEYRMAERALKYAVLFLALTFLSYFVFEITSEESKKIHPLQYALLGISMLLFYLLLVSFSEFMPFITAYVISAFMIISLINAYTYFVITKQKNFKFTFAIYSLLVLLYVFLYILLSLQDFSLLVGSIGLFIIIALIMYSTRNVNWYSEN